MIINSILIKNFGQIKGYYGKVSNTYTVLPGCNTSDYLLAVAGSLAYPVNREEFNEKIGNTGCIQCGTDNIEEVRALGENSIVCACKEYMACSIFQNTVDEQFDKKLHMYLTPSEYYKEKDFNNITNGFGETKVFRSYLHRFIKDFKPIVLPSENALEVYIDKNGYFRSRDSQTKNSVNLTNDEELLFKLICFNVMHSFWEGAMELRSNKVPNIPLLVGNLHWNYGECHLHSTALHDVLKTDSQTVIFTD